MINVIIAIVAVVTCGIAGYELYLRYEDRKMRNAGRN